MQESLSIRAYTRQRDEHQHPFVQMVLPLNGVINIKLPNFRGQVGVGEAVLIVPATLHQFHAHEQARFVVADLASIPTNLIQLPCPVFRLAPAVQAYLQFVETQLHQCCPTATLQQMVGLFKQLLEQQPVSLIPHRGIRAATEYIQRHPDQELTTERLCEIACLSATQFKQLFRQTLHMSVGTFIRQVRMQKAQALLRQTDMPVTLVALEVGYRDVSAFSRRFHAFFGRSPKYFSQRNKLSHCQPAES